MNDCGVIAIGGVAPAERCLDALAQNVLRVALVVHKHIEHP